MFLHALIQILFITLGLVGIVLLLYWYSVQKGILPNQTKQTNPALRIDIESQQFLEPRKSLYVVRVGEKRFLLASTDSSVSLISMLDPASIEELEQIESLMQATQQHYFAAGKLPFTSFKEQFLYSIKMLAQERFKR